MAVNFVVRCKAKDLVEAIRVAWEQNMNKEKTMYSITVNSTKMVDLLNLMKKVKRMDVNRASLDKDNRFHGNVSVSFNDVVLDAMPPELAERYYKEAV